ncbi:MAG TPA: hypothetical protein VM513_08290 [Kofleriaceae bacterium]|jgi:type II secretory pathway pseudopilin PulG|nr:hypothetical protein [Kofleriaceae bacterium]
MKLAIAVVMTMALAGCKRAGHEEAGSKPGVTSPAIDALIAGVPGNAAAIGFVDLDKPPWTFVTGGVMPLADATRTTLDKELREYIDRYVGLDVSKLQYAVGFISGPPAGGAVLLKTIGGTLKLPGATDFEGAKLWVIDDVLVATKGDLVVLGKDDAVRAAIETLAGKRKSVTAENKALVDWLHAETQGAVFGFAAIVPKGLPLPPQVAGLQRTAVSIGRGGVRAVIDGEDAAISSIQKIIDEAFAMALGEVQRAHDAAIAGDIPPPEGAFAIIASAYAKDYAAKLKPRREGNRLVASLDLAAGGGGEMMTVVSVVGILSAVAIPAFMSYMKKSKVSETALQLNKLGKNLKVVYAESSTFPVGDAPLTPAESCCNGPNHKCAGDPSAWIQIPMWRELDFLIDEPHLFQYRYHSDGKTAVVEAIGDLDCDGNTITYRLEATSDNGMPRVQITEPAPGMD